MILLRKFINAVVGSFDREDMVYLFGAGLMAGGSWMLLPAAGLIVGGSMLVAPLILARMRGPK